MKNDVVRPTKKGFSDCKKICADYACSYCAYPPVMRWRTPEFTGVFGFILSVIFGIFMLLQYVSLKEYQFPKATTLLCATPFSRKAIVSSKYIFCIAIYAICCIVFELETLFMPGLGTSDIKLFAFMFLIVSVFIGIYLPIQYKFGYEKTNFAFRAIIVASPFILPLLMRAGSLNLNFLSMFSPYLVYGGIVLIGFAILAISASLSIKIYDKADLA